MIFSPFKQVKIAIKLLIIISVLTGLLYPLCVTGLAQLFFPKKANGSLISQEGKIIGSELLGQSFTEAKYFWGRPSATLPYPYNAAASSGSNLGPSNPNYLSIIKGRVASLQKVDPAHQALVPVDLVTASGSGLDPHISPLDAYYQVPRIAKARGFTPDEVKALVQKQIQKPCFGFLGEQRVNVLALNLALDQLTKQRPHHA